jgi:hypothetical protein
MNFTAKLKVAEKQLDVALAGDKDADRGEHGPPHRFAGGRGRVTARNRQIVTLISLGKLIREFSDRVSSRVSTWKVSISRPSQTGSSGRIRNASAVAPLARVGTRAG